jgi:hypothetical protein
MRKIIYPVGLLIISLIGNTNLFGQVSIKGPTCVVPGITYTYNIQGNWDSLSTMKVCLTGGVIADSTDTTMCTRTGAPLNAITVIWNNVTSGSLVLTSSIGDTTLNTAITTPLSGGAVDTTVKTQMIGNDSIPATINCTAASGGACSPSYLYQWQQSSDIVSWTDMPGATEQNLTIDSGLTKSVYYRRKVIESPSGSLAYSDVAAVFVGISGLKNKLNMGELYCYFNNDFNKYTYIIIIQRVKISKTAPYNSHA